MDSRINRISLAWGISGIIIQWSYPMLKTVISSPLLDSLPLPLLIVGTVLLFVGLAYYAKAKGRSPAWGFLGLLSILGILILYLLPDKLKSTDAAVTTP